MKRVFMTSFVAMAVLLAVAGCRSSADLTRPETQRQFGVRMAKMNLWREAMFRFQRAVELEPQNAMAYNNLAVAYEAVGDFDAAAAAYREALRLDRSNQYIQRNYSRYVEFTQRTKRREARPPSVSAAAVAADAANSEAPTDASADPEPPQEATPESDAGATPALTPPSPDPEAQPPSDSGLDPVPEMEPEPPSDPDVPPVPPVDEPTPATGGAA
jgi:hypothetical protein